MTRDEARQAIKSNWQHFYPADGKKKGIICPICGSGSGPHGTGITEDPKRPGQLKCWACDFSGDVIDLYMQEHNADYPEALKAMADDLGLTIDQPNQEGPTAADAFGWDDIVDTATGRAANLEPTDPPKSRQNGPKIDSDKADDKKDADDTKTENKATTEPTAPLADYSEYYETCRARLSDPAAASYLKARRISDTMAKMAGLGYDPAWVSPTVVKNKEKEGDSWRPSPTARIIMPVSANHYVARAIDPACKKEFAKMNECGGGSPGIFNSTAICDPGPIFVTEGIFDALSIAEVGGVAVALNSTSNTNLLLQQLKDAGQAVTAKFILCLDDDDAGPGATAKLAAGLDELGIDHVTADITGGHKDPNEALVADWDAFKAAVEAAKEASPLPGLLTLEAAIKEFSNADDQHIELQHFPEFSTAAKISVHDSVVLAADTGAGKSSLALNFINDLNDRYPVIYFNLEMDTLTVLRRLVAIQSGMILDLIEGYRKDDQARAAVNKTLQEITTRKPLQVLQDVYGLEKMEATIKQATRGRSEPTIVVIDHSLLVTTETKTAGRYERFTRISEELRRMSRTYNVIMFVLLQQSRAGKQDETEPPTNSSLKESGSWENDATHILFLWYDPAVRRKKLLITKNRNGETGSFLLDYSKHTQQYSEAKDQEGPTGKTVRQTKRDKKRDEIHFAYMAAMARTGGAVTLEALADEMDVTTNTVKNYIREYGGFTIDGQAIDAAGKDARVENTAIVRMREEDLPEADRQITAKF